MDYMAYLPIAIAIFMFIIYAIMVWATYLYLNNNLGNGLNDSAVADARGYSMSVPLAIGFSGLGMGLLGGLYAYAQVNTTYVFTVSVGLTSFALALSFAGLGLSALTH